MTTRHRLHALAPVKRTARAMLCYRSFAGNKSISHVGLGITALNTQRTLRQHGYWVDAHAVASAQQIEDLLAQKRAEAVHRDENPVTHVVIYAPWVATKDLQAMLTRHTDIDFAVVSHSNVGFLTVDPQAIQLLRDGLELSLSHHNFVVGGNSQKFVRAFTAMYGRPLTWFPNLYDCSTIKAVGQRVPWHPGGVLRIGVFGATRPLKNMITAVAAAVQVAQQLKADTEIWMNVGRAENAGAAQIPSAVSQLTRGLRGIKIVESGWQGWPGFRDTVSRMNLLISPSFTETFCNVVADGVAEGVAAVTSDAVDWVPEDWVATSDEVDDVARVARRLITDPHAVNEGQEALRSYVERGTLQWQQILGA